MFTQGIVQPLWRQYQDWVACDRFPTGVLRLAVAPLSLSFGVYRGLFPRHTKRHECEAGQSTLARAEVKKDGAISPFLHSLHVAWYHDDGGARILRNVGSYKSRMA
jgi:hypothetical protein